MKTIAWIPWKQKTGLISLIVTVILLQSTVSTPSLKTLGVGTEAPDFKLQDLSGAKQSLSSVGGDKLTLLIFWATWSNHSEKALTEMEKLQEKYKDQGLSVVGINVERQSINSETVTAIGGVADRLKLSFPILIDHGLTAFHDYGVIAVPTAVIVDKNKKIQFEMSGWPAVTLREMMRFVSAIIEGKKTGTAEMAQEGHFPANDAERFLNMGNQAMASKRTVKGAEKWFKKAISADPAYLLPYLSLGAFYQKMGKQKDAKEQFEKAVTLQPDNSLALGGLALMLMEEGNNSAAKELVEKAIKTDEAYTPGYYYLGYIKGKEGDMQRAEELFNRAEEINPLDYRIHVYRGKMFEEQNNPGEAVKNYKSALKLLLRLQ